MEKKERVSKQSKQEAANKRDAMKNTSTKQLPSTIAITNDYRSSIPTKKQDLQKTLKIAQKSTISMGKFDNLVEGEKRVKEKKKFDPLISSGEKTKNIKVLNKVLGPSEGSLDIAKAVNRVIQTQQRKRSKQRKQ